MRALIKTIRLEFAKRFANRKTATVSAVILFSLLFLLGSTPPLRGASAARRAGEGSAVPGSAGMGLPSAGGSPAVGAGARAAGAEGRIDRGLFFTAYKVAKGDTLSGIADDFNVTLDTVVSFNGIKNARTLQPGRILKIPSMSGILVSAKEGEVVASIAAANSVSPDRVIDVNGLRSDRLEAGRRLFLPDAKLASFTLREISGDLFGWPVRGWLSSWYGWRSDPFSGSRVFHNGIDVGVDTGTPVRAAMDGSVSETGYNSSFGNYVVLYHHAGWESLYGHLQSVSVKAGQRVAAGQLIARSGNTGYSTGPHLHFSVFKNGRTVNPYNVLH